MSGFLIIIAAALVLVDWYLIFGDFEDYSWLARYRALLVLGVSLLIFVFMWIAL